MKNFILAIGLTITLTCSLSGQIVLNEIRASDSAVEILNTGGSTVNIGTYWLCRFPNYSQLSSLTVLCGNLNLAAGALVTVDLNYVLDPADDELGLYTSADFANSGAIVDYVEWGSSGHVRSSVAVAAAIWTTDDFVPAWDDCASLEYDGSGDSSSDWNSQDEPTMPCLSNSFDGCSIMMPMELLSFNARPAKSGARISWEAIHDPTATIVFLEHSLDMDTWDIATRWVPLGPELDRGAFDHMQLASGMHYYRLSIHYQDGTTDLSPFETVKVCATNFNISIRPNPTTDRINVFMGETGLPGPIEVLLTDTRGRILERQYAGSDLELDLSGLPDGVYIVQVPTVGTAERVLKY